ncbi:MAG: hypothetical protein AAF648_11080 [Pseudomonadota bacterium]
MRAQRASGAFARAVLSALIALWFCGAARADPRVDYLLHCAGCHLENGRGDPPRVPDLRRDLDVFATDRAGRAYLTQVPGAAQVPIDDTALARVLNWMLREFYPDRRFAAFDGDEVGRTRHTILADPLKRRRQLLAAISSNRPDQIP